MAFLSKRGTKLVMTSSSRLAKFQSLQEDVTALKRTLTDKNLQPKMPEVQLVELEVAAKKAEAAKHGIETEQKMPREIGQELNSVRQDFGMVFSS